MIQFYNEKDFWQADTQYNCGALVMYKTPILTPLGNKLKFIAAKLPLPYSIRKWLYQWIEKKYLIETKEFIYQAIPLYTSNEPPDKSHEWVRL